jgi:glucose-6-phosphate 1-dehydrogenase
LTVAVLAAFDMLLFGGTGDPVPRQLPPALYRRYALFEPLWRRGLIKR